MWKKFFLTPEIKIYEVYLSYIIDNINNNIEKNAYMWKEKVLQVQERSPVEQLWYLAQPSSALLMLWLISICCGKEAWKPILYSALIWRGRILANLQFRNLAEF